MFSLGKYIETDRKFYKRLLAIAVPVILQSLITTGVNLADNVMLGQLTEVALSASTQANQFITLFTFAVMGISMGASVLSARFYGAGDFVSLKKVITLVLRCCLGIGAIFTLLDIFIPQQIMSLYFASVHVEEINTAVTYLRWSLPAFFLVSISSTLTNIMRSTGRSKVPLWAAICAFSINIGANYVFIFGKLGMPKMGVAGAALGTVIARVVETSIILLFFLLDKNVHYAIRDIFTPCADMLPVFLKIALPVLLSDYLLGVGDSVLAIIMGQIGPTFVSAYAISNLTRQVTSMLITGLAFSGCFLTGHVLGEGDVAAARKQGTTYLLIGLAVGAVSAVLIQIICEPVISIYNITDETKELVRQLMDALSIIVIFRSSNCILTKGVLRGGGDTRFLLAIDISTMWLFAVPLGALAGLYLHLNAFWTCMFLSSDQIIKAIWCTFRLKSGKWIKVITDKTVEEE